MRIESLRPSSKKASINAIKPKGRKPQAMGNLIEGAKISTILVIFILCFLNPAASTINVNFGEGAYIIDMGSVSTFPYNYSTGLKPYGLVYDLVINKEIPVSWAINATKSKDGVDFTVGGKNYQGGPLIVPAEYASLALSTINLWKAKGVVVDGPIASSFTAPIYGNITSFPNTVCDLQNGAIILSAFYSKAEVPSSSFRLGSPQDLGSCDDIYTLPHADPQSWTALQNATFKSFIDGGGCLWAACHAVSELESPTPTYLGWYFLTADGMIPWGSHSNPAPPYSYNASSATHPIMQFLGSLDNALQSGTERVYLPRLGSSWRSSTTVAVWDPDQIDVTAGKSPGKAAIVAYGRAEGNMSKGFIVYEASHSLDTGDVSENIDAARVYGNELLMCGIMKQLGISMSVPSAAVSDQTVTLSATASGGTPSYAYRWSSTCGGVFSSPNAATTTFTPPSVSVTTSCIIRFTVTDQCGRKDFGSRVLTIYPTVMTLNKTDLKEVVQPEQILNYSIYYRNQDLNLNASDVTVTDLLPSQLTYIPTSYPAPASVTNNPNGTTTLTWNLGTVSKNSGYKAIRLNASVKATVSSGTVEDNVTLYYKVSGNGPFSLQAQDVDLASPLNKMVNQTLASAGNYLRYTLCPNYNGIKLLVNAIVRDTIPPNTIYVTGSVNASGNYASGNKTLLWRLGSNSAGVPGRVTAHSAINGYLRNVAVNDTYLRESNPYYSYNYGAATTLYIDGYGTNERNAILYFALPTLPTDAVFTGANLDVTVTSTRSGTTISIYRLTRDWCLHANSICSACANGIVEGLLNGAQPTSNYGATWNNYNYRQYYVSCPWTTAGGDYDSSHNFGSFSGATAGLKTTTITDLVRGWYNGTYALQGILLRNSANDIQIGSREYGISSSRPYLNVSYTIPATPTTNVVMTAKPLLSCGGTAYVNMTVNSSAITTITAPSTLSISSTGGAAASMISGPTPSSYTNVPAGTNVTFQYRYTLTPGTIPGTISFTGSPTSTTATFHNATSETLLITPRLGYTVTIDPSTSPSVSYINNTANLSDSNAFITPEDSNLVSTMLYWSASIDVDKATNISQGPPSTYVNFTLNVSNTGQAALNPVKVVDTLPNGLEYISSSSGGSPNMNQVTWTNIGPLAHGTYKRLYIVAHIDGTAFGNLTNVVNVTGKTVDGRYVRDNDTEVVRALSAGMAVIKSSNLTQGPPCQYLNFTLNVTNTGEATLDPVELTDVFMEGLEYVSSNPTATYVDAPNNTVVWSNRGPLAQGQKSLTYLVLHANGDYYGEIDNTVIAKGKLTTGLNLTGINFSSVYVREPKILVNKTVNLSEGAPSTRVNFTINVSNIGETYLNPAIVKDTVPYGLDNIVTNGTVSGNNVTWDLGNMTVGRRVTLYMEAHINGSAYGNLTNVVNATGKTYTNWYVHSQDSRNVTARRASVLIQKTADPLEGEPGETINFTINVTNTGEVSLNPVKVVDVLPAGLAYVYDNRSGSVSGNTITWANVGPLGPAASTYILLQTSIDGSVLGYLTNHVNATGTPPRGDEVRSQATAVVRAYAVSDIEITKTAIPKNISQDENVTFIIKVTNIGRVLLRTVRVVDILPVMLTYVSDNQSGNVTDGVITWEDLGQLGVNNSTYIELKARMTV
jgi:uncharacterized repeat protein (TIGR01451 family)